jgi:hypothetical protein
MECSGQCFEIVQSTPMLPENMQSCISYFALGNHQRKGTIQLLLLAVHIPHLSLVKRCRLLLVLSVPLLLDTSRKMLCCFHVMYAKFMNPELPIINYFLNRNLWKWNILLIIERFAITSSFFFRTFVIYSVFKKFFFALRLWTTRYAAATRFAFSFRLGSDIFVWSSSPVEHTTTWGLPNDGLRACLKYQ